MENHLESRRPIGDPEQNGSRLVYHEGDKNYVPDTCRPLVAAAQAGRVQLHALGRGGYPGQRLSEDELRELRSIGFWDAGPNQDWGLPPHRNEGIEISFLANGQTCINVEAHELVLGHDELMITRPWQEHSIGDPHIGACKLVWLILDLDVRRPHQEWRWPPWIVLSRQDLAELTLFLRQNEQYVWKVTPELRYCFARLAKTLAETAQGNHSSRLAVLINEVMLDLVAMFRQRAIPLEEGLTSSERTVRIFLKELEQALDQEWTLNAMAESCHMGVTQFVQYFRNVTNLTPAHYLNCARIERSKELLLRHPDHSVTAIAFECGFSSSQYFSDRFHKTVGCSPREFREQNLLPGASTKAKTGRDQ